MLFHLHWLHCPSICVEPELSKETVGKLEPIAKILKVCAQRATYPSELYENLSLHLMHLNSNWVLVLALPLSQEIQSMSGFYCLCVHSRQHFRVYIAFKPVRVLPLLLRSYKGGVFSFIFYLSSNVAFDIHETALMLTTSFQISPWKHCTPLVAFEQFIQAIMIHMYHFRSQLGIFISAVVYW